MLKDETGTFSSTLVESHFEIESEAIEPNKELEPYRNGHHKKKKKQKTGKKSPLTPILDLVDTEIEVNQPSIDTLEIPLEEKLSLQEKEGNTENSLLVHSYYKLQYNQTDSGNAEMFVDAFKGNVYYNHTSKEWMYWNRKEWVADTQQYITQLALRAMRHRAAINNRITVTAEDEATRKLKQAEKQWCLRSENERPLNQMLRLASSSPLIATHSGEWDKQRHLIGVENGIVDLYTGRLVNPTETKHLKMVKRCRATYLFNGYEQEQIEQESKKAEIWTRFLSNIFTSSTDELQTDLQEYILSAMGYSLTGFTDDKSFFCLYGQGENGKSVALSILRQIMHNYANVMPFSALEMTNRNQLSNDIAALRGMRFIAASETQEGKQLNEGRIKAITGDEDLTGRFLYQESITFRPELKLWLAFNHKPLVTDETSSFWNRLKLIELENCFVRGDPRRIPRLEERLLEEKDLILSILIQYAKKYLEDGLVSPDKIKFNISEYRKESNPIQDFINDCCEVGTGDDFQVETVVLYRAYLAWCKDFNKRALGRNNFYNKMYAAGFERQKATAIRDWYFKGIKLEDKIGNLRYFDKVDWD